MFATINSMPRTRKISSQVEPYLERIAQLYFESHAKGKFQEEDLGVTSVSAGKVQLTLEDETGIKFTRTDIENAIQYWRKSGRVRVDFISEKDVDDRNLIPRQIRDLKVDLMHKYPLLQQCELVHGILSSEGGYQSDDDESRERVIRELGETGGHYLSDALSCLLRKTSKKRKPGTSDSSIGICVGAGSAVRSAINQILLPKIPKDALVDIVPMTGLLGWRRVGASPLANARLLEYVFSGQTRLHWYSTPAIIPLDVENVEDGIEYNAELIKKSLESLPMVKHVDDLRKKSSVYIFSVSRDPQIKRWSSDQWHLISQKSADDYDNMPKGKGPIAVGSLSGLVFDKDGKQIEGLPWLPMGVTLSELHDAAHEKVHAGSLSVLIVGGHPDRIPAVKALLKGEYVNVLVTDVFTARELL